MDDERVGERVWLIDHLVRTLAVAPDVEFAQANYDLASWEIDQLQAETEAYMLAFEFTEDPIPCDSEEMREFLQAAQLVKWCRLRKLDAGAALYAFIHCLEQ